MGRSEIELKPESPGIELKLVSPEIELKLGNSEMQLKLGNPEIKLKLGSSEIQLKLGRSEIEHNQFLPNSKYIYRITNISFSKKRKDQEKNSYEHRVYESVDNESLP